MQEIITSGRICHSSRQDPRLNPGFQFNLAIYTITFHDEFNKKHSTSDDLVQVDMTLHCVVS